jgi:hypothetical protein
MKQALRTALFAATVLTALAFASSAFASYSPKLVISSSNAGQGTRIGVVVGANDDPTAVTTIYVPTAYQIATPSAGTKLGDVTATAAALDLGGIVLPLTGELDAIAPTATTGAEAQACGVTPAQTWDLHLSAAGNTLDIPVFIVTSPQPVAAAGYANEIVVCLPPPDVPIGTPGRSFDGAKLLSATFETSAIGEPAATGDYRWTSTWTPYTPGTGQPNTAGSVETQSIRHHPTSMVFDYIRHKVTTAKTKIVKVKGKRKKITTKVITTKVTYTAKSTENGKAPVDVVYAVDVNGKTKNGASGSFTLAHGKSAKVAVAALIDADSGAVPTGVQPAVTDLLFHDLGATSCTPTPIFQGLPCIDATLGGTVLVAEGTIKAF